MEGEPTTDDLEDVPARRVVGEVDETLAAVDLPRELPLDNPFERSPGQRVATGVALGAEQASVVGGRAGRDS